MPASPKVRQCLRSQCPQRNFSTIAHKNLATQPPKTPSKFPTSSLSYHWDTTPPTPHQLSHASKFFKLQPPTFLWSAPKLATMSFGTPSTPEICFLGRSNVGKSSLLNALLCKKIAHTSSKPGRTKLMNAFAVGSSEIEGGGLVVLDMPGYGKGGREEWGKEILKYLAKRPQLKRAFLLVDAEHGVKNSDKQILALLKEHEVPFQIVLSKADKVVLPGSRVPGPDLLAGRIAELRRTMEGVKDAVGEMGMGGEEDDGLACGEVVACSSEKWVEGTRMGIDAVRFAMLRAAGLELKVKGRLARPVEIIPHDQIFG